jgi:hypothetical protein
VEALKSEVFPMIVPSDLAIMELLTTTPEFEFVPNLTQSQLQGSNDGTGYKIQRKSNPLCRASVVIHLGAAERLSPEVRERAKQAIEAHVSPQHALIDVM